MQRQDKRQSNSVGFYLNIWFIANVQLYPNNPVNNRSRIRYSNDTSYLCKTHSKSTKSKVLVCLETFLVEETKKKKKGKLFGSSEKNNNRVHHVPLITDRHCCMDQQKEQTKMLEINQECIHSQKRWVLLFSPPPLWSISDLPTSLLRSFAVRRIVGRRACRPGIFVFKKKNFNF